MSWISPYIVRIGSLLLLSAAALWASTAHAAASNTSYVFGNKTYTFTHVESRGQRPAIAVDDPQFQAILDKLGVSLTWQSGDPYVVFTTAQRRTVSFKVGDAQYDVNGVPQVASFAPFIQDGIPYISFLDIARALGLALISNGSQTVLQPIAAAQSTGPMPIPAHPAQLARVTGVDLSTGDAPQVDVSVEGDARYQWHRLRDNRWYVDIGPARLSVPVPDQTASEPLLSVRVRQTDARTVRVALTMSGDDAVDVAPSARGLRIVVRNQMADATGPRLGAGTIGTLAAVATSAPQSPAPYAPPSAPYTASEPRLIIIDPGHGGSDPGTIANGLEEKTLALDMARRLRDVLVARGWKVVLTRDSDRDVYAPNAPDRAELQARVDAANNRGARLFISIHVNGFPNSGPHGTTTYYSKASDVQLARDIERRMAATLGTTDDGIVKSKLYVTLHAAMPAVLVETAFLTNPFDAQKLGDPAWRQKVAQAIAQGIADYAGSSENATAAGGDGGQRQ